MTGQTAAVLNAEFIRIKWRPETGDRFAELREWIAAVMQPDIPPIYRLVDPGELRARAPRAFQDEILLGMRSTRRMDSGALEITFSDGRRFLDAGPRLVLAELARLARAEDLRTFSPIDVGESAFVASALTSRVSDSSNLPVIGPGGRVTMFREGDRVEADIVVRKRRGAIKCEWRNPEVMIQRLRDLLSRERGAVEISAQFGYLELSKYEAQSLMRPAFSLVLEGFGSADFRVPWQMAVVEPATVNQEIPIDEGLGAWGDSVLDE